MVYGRPIPQTITSRFFRQETCCIEFVVGKVKYSAWKLVERLRSVNLTKGNQPIVRQCTAGDTDHDRVNSTGDKSNVVAKKPVALEMRNP